MCLSDLVWNAATHEISGLLGSEHFKCSAFYDDSTQSIHLSGSRGLSTLKYRGLTTDVEGEAAVEGTLTAPMPGKVIALLVDKGATVKQGQPLLVMEAMKMEHTMTAPKDGLVESFNYAVGDQVPEGATLLAFKAA